jgi:hypothetical protein
LRRESERHRSHGEYEVNELCYLEVTNHFRTKQPGHLFKSQAVEEILEFCPCASTHIAATTMRGLDCSGRLSHKKRSICQAIATERAALIVDNDRQRVPYPLSGYVSSRAIGDGLHQEQWKQHPNWTKQTLIISHHRRFRGVSQDIVSGVLDLYENYLDSSSHGARTLSSLKSKLVEILRHFQEELISHAGWVCSSPRLLSCD